MASGRVGGTKAKVSGLIGDAVYKVVRNPDGTYSQVVNIKGQQTITNTSPALQVQRMVTAMVESLMKDLRPIARISMQAYANKSKSLNGFSSLNINLVNQDVRAHWYGGNRFVYPKHGRDDVNVRDLGGHYLISAGTLLYNLFDEKVFDPIPRAHFINFPAGYDSIYGVRFNIPNEVLTIGDFLRAHRATRLDSIVFCGFRDWFTYDQQNEEPVEHIKHQYFILSVNVEVPDDAPFTDDNVDKMFVVNASAPVTLVWANDHKSFVVGFPCDLDGKDDQFYYWAAFSISYADGRKKISSSSYSSPDGRDDPWFTESTPAKVFGSWIGEPGNSNYPNPFL